MASCPFCIDMNSFEYGKLGIDDREIEALQEEILAAGFSGTCTVLKLENYQTLHNQDKPL